MTLPIARAAKITGFLTVAFLIVSCTFTTTRQKRPQFRSGIDTVGHSIDSIVSCQHINMNGVEKSTNGKVVSELEVDIVNGTNIPKDDTQIKALGRTIAARVKSELKVDQDFTAYKVLFVTQSTNGTVTNRQYTGFIFKSAELSQ
jgi:hypothetical protein